MRGIDEETLLAVRKSLAAEGLNTDVIDALISLKIKELQESWMTFEEFLESGFEGLCWIEHGREVKESYYNGVDFLGNFFAPPAIRKIFHKDAISRVMPIPKPEALKL